MRTFKDFLKYEAAGGILLALTAAIAIIVKNSSLESFYDGFLKIPVVIQIGAFAIDKPLLLWINDGFMAVFFLLVGLELKREILEGQLSSRDQILLPSIAAFGGLICPALIYVYINYNDPTALKGWAIPAATDIAFALGVISLLGKRVPDALKVTLVAIAIIDDIAAIAIIAFFYTDSLSMLSLGVGSVALIILFYLNQKGVTSRAAYIIPGIFLWACVLKSGIHATLAGVVLALFIPLKAKESDTFSPLKDLEHSLHPWIAFGILPIFAFANAGISLKGLSLDILFHPISLGIMVGLFVGKQIGVMLMTFIGKATGIAKLPTGTNWIQYYGMSLLTGIGFTMSLFIGTLAFEDPEVQTLVRIGVIVGSLFSGFLGYLVLHWSTRKTVAR